MLTSLPTKNATLQGIDPVQDTKKATQLPNIVLCRILECCTQLQSFMILNHINIKLFFKGVVPALLFYVIIIVAIFVGEKIVPSGICNPGLAIWPFFVVL